jgi:hypothetical protein
MTIDTSLPFHFKDYRHAHVLVQSSNFDAAPKAKFLYHVVFELTADARPLISSDNLNLLSVLAKTVSLPSYTATIETLNQYNRKKKVQTKIEYKDINISFYDDNASVSSTLLKTYYNYYFAEGSAGGPENISPRDTYSNEIPKRFGLDNSKKTPFFSYIKIFQLSKQKWFCYTLVNPIISQWSHDELAYAEGAAITENKITVGYEAVVYTEGTIEDKGYPAGFAEVWYDLEKPPAVYTNPPSPNVKPNVTPAISDAAFKEVNGNSGDPILISYGTTGVGYPPGYSVPKSRARTETTALSSGKTGKYDSAQIQNILSTDQALLNTVTNLALGSGSYSSEWGPANFSNYAKLSQQEKATIQQDILSNIETNSRLRIIAEKAITARPPTELSA